jgi:DNA-binding XRE family transcriptional regulator
MSKHHKAAISAGAAAYTSWRDEFMADPTNRAIYEAEAANSELWLQLYAAREAAGLSKKELAQRLGVSEWRVAQIEREGYSCSLKTLRRYIVALGEGFSLEISVHKTI